MKHTCESCAAQDKTVAHLREMLELSRGKQSTLLRLLGEAQDALQRLSTEAASNPADESRFSHPRLDL